MSYNMKLWECTYKVTRSTDSFYVKDWVWSTTKPEGDRIGHYWRVGFQYQITDGKSYPAPEGADISRFRISDNPF